MSEEKSFELRIESLVAKAVTAAKCVETCEKALKDAARSHTELVEVAIPALLKEAGLKEIKTTNGVTVTIKNEVYANISRARQPEAFQWLRDNNHGSMIKTEVSVRLDPAKNDPELTARTIASITGLDPELTQSVHVQTLRAFAREALESGMDLPLELFGIYNAEVAKIK